MRAKMVDFLFGIEQRNKTKINTKSTAKWNFERAQHTTKNQLRTRKSMSHGIYYIFAFLSLSSFSFVSISIFDHMCFRWTKMKTRKEEFLSNISEKSQRNEYLSTKWDLSFIDGVWPLSGYASFPLFYALHTSRLQSQHFLIFWKLRRWMRRTRMTHVIDRSIGFDFRRVTWP